MSQKSESSRMETEKRQPEGTEEYLRLLSEYRPLKGSKPAILLDQEYYNRIFGVSLRQAT